MGRSPGSCTCHVEKENVMSTAQMQPASADPDVPALFSEA